MLTYLINVTSDMLALSLLIGMIAAFIDTYCKTSGKITIRIGIGAGIRDGCLPCDYPYYCCNTCRQYTGCKDDTPSSSVGSSARRSLMGGAGK